jgi:hypothetical protein
LQIKASELEAAGLKHLGGFVHGHALGFFIGALGLLPALLAWALSGELRHKGGNSHVRPIIFIHLPGLPSPPTYTSDPFPSPPQLAYDDHRDDKSATRISIFRIYGLSLKAGGLPPVRRAWFAAIL